jgi:outer membrane biosynthesis protein TonB
MSAGVHSPYREPESTTTRWIVYFVLLSLLAHVLIITAILLITRFMPPPKIQIPDSTGPTITITRAPPAPSQKKIFIPTKPEANAKHVDQLIESANDHDLTTKSTVARKPESIMPDVNGKPHAPDLNSSPKVEAPTKPPEVSSTPPTPKQDTPQKPTPPQPNPSKAQVPPPPKPPQPAPKPLPPTPPKKAEPQVDPNTGLPVLPVINAPTLAPPNSAAQPVAPSPSQLQQATSIHGALGQSGDNSPAAMATELGKYKQYVYSVVGSYWYPSVDKAFGTIGVGVVHIQFTIHSDGTLSDVAILDGDNLEILKNISTQALRAPAPFKPFSDAMIKQVGDSYTDDFTFSVY